MCKSVHPISAVLPLDARMSLVRAAATPVTDEDPLARVRAVNEASKRIKFLHSNLFTKETK